MAYGKNKDRKGWLMRAVPLGVGSLPAGKRAALAQLRSQVLALMRTMAAAGFCAEPLASDLRGKELDAKLLEIQRSAEGLNSVWREQARMRVKPALEETVARYFRRLAGSLCFVDARIPEAERADGGRRYYHVPPDIQDSVCAAELARLKAVAGSGQALDLFRAVIVDRADRFAGEMLTANQLAILRDIHARSLAKHRCPDFGGDDFLLQLHIDSRMLPTGQAPEALEVRNGVAFLLADEGNRRYHRFLDLAGVAPRGERIRIPLALSRRLAQRLEATRPDWASLIVELCGHHVGVRLVAGMPKPSLPESVFAVVGRDFGYANTVSLSVASSDDPIAVPTGTLRSEGREAAKSFFETHQLPSNVRIVERVRFEGRAFLKRIDTLCARIDGLKSRIDVAYNALGALRSAIARGLGLQEGERITPEMKRGRLGEKVRTFFRTFGLIQDLKKARRALYRKIAAIKKAWFGFLSNVEVRLARKHNAMVVREDLTILAAEKDRPGYKGRTFNKMLNNGSKGQYQRRAADKLRWNGVPEVALPSWYTSRACTTHSTIVAAQHRQGETIYLPCCGRHEHADEHASDTLAQFLFLTPRLTPDGASPRPGFVTPACPQPLAVGSSAL
jgi:hypothetical protein